MMCGLHVLQYLNGPHSQAEAMSNSEKINPVALVVVELSSTEGVRQAGRRVDKQVGSQSVEKSAKYIFLIP